MRPIDLVDAATDPESVGTPQGPLFQKQNRATILAVDNGLYVGFGGKRWNSPQCTVSQRALG